MKIIDLLTCVPVALPDNAPNGYPANEVGYFRMYHKKGYAGGKGTWYGTAFPVSEGLHDTPLVREFDSVINAFRDAFPDVSAMSKWCRDHGAAREDWCGYDSWTYWLTLDHGIYKLILRNMPGDYNAYIHCFKKEG